MTEGTIEKEIEYVKRMLSIAGDDHEKRCFWQGKLTILQRWLAASKAQDREIERLKDKLLEKCNLCFLMVTNKKLEQRIKFLEAELRSRKTQMEKLCEKVNKLEASTLTKDEARGIIEGLADIEHTQWAHWTMYMLDNLTKDNIKKWKRQTKEPYYFLNEREKESDRVWARKVIDFFAKKGVDLKGKEREVV